MTEDELKMVRALQKDRAEATARAEAAEKRWTDYHTLASHSLAIMTARTEAAEKRVVVLREALAEIAYLESPQIRGKPRRQSIHDIANAALEAQP